VVVVVVVVGVVVVGVVVVGTGAVAVLAVGGAVAVAEPDAVPEPELAGAPAAWTLPGSALSPPPESEVSATTAMISPTAMTPRTKSSQLTLPARATVWDPLQALLFFWLQPRLTPSPSAGVLLFVAAPSLTEYV
jgi:hypothetical protein